jgi:hypothetical protein
VQLLSLALSLFLSRLAHTKANALLPTAQIAGVRRRRRQSVKIPPAHKFLPLLLGIISRPIFILFFGYLCFSESEKKKKNMIKIL